MLRFAILVFLTLSLESLARCGMICRIDFEKPAPFTTDGATVTDAAGSVISGGRSLLADFSKAGDGWHEYLKTGNDVRFEPCTAYHISFRYRVVDPGASRTRFYSLLRSRSGGDIYGEFWLWNNRSGAEGTIHRLFHIDRKDDWNLILGVRHQGSIIIDDIEISKCEDGPPWAKLPVNPGNTGLLARKAALDRIRASEGLQQTLGDMLVVWCNEGAGDKIVSRRAEYAGQLSPDFVDWNSCGPLARDSGVRTSDGGPEYQEFYKAEGPSVWETRYQRFENNGFAESLDGTLIQDETWGEGGYFTCHNGDSWHRWFLDETLRRNHNYMAMCQDNIGCAPFYKGHGCFCEPCTQKFRSWLKARYSAAELGRLGVVDVDSFAIRDRVMAYDLTGQRAIEDPIVREYIKFQFCSQLEAWAHVVDRVKADGASRGFAVPCYGNQFGAGGSQPFAVALGQFGDIVQIEEYSSVGRKIPNCSLYYKMGRAGGHETKPVWVRGPVLDKNKKQAPQLSPLFWETHLAEALANGGVRDISFGVNAPWTGDPSTADYIDSPDVRKVWQDYAGLCTRNRAVFTHRKSLARVALVYSLPSTMFRRFYPLGIDEAEVFSRFDDTASWLDSIHVPYDCVIFGHPEFFETDGGQLKQYDALVLPAADALSDAQFSLIKQFAARGGKVFALGTPGVRDENLNLRPGGTPLVGLRITDLSIAREDAARALHQSSVVQCDAPGDVTVNAWLSCGGSALDVHLVNYGADLVAGVANPSKPIHLTVSLPTGLRFDTVRLIRFGKEPEALHYSVHDGLVSVTVPALKSYAVVSFADGATLDAANASARQRREQDAQRVKQLAREKDLY